MPPLKVFTRNTTPICSGFGSSSAAIVGGLVAGLVLCGKELKDMAYSQKEAVEVCKCGE